MDKKLAKGLQRVIDQMYGEVGADDQSRVKLTRMMSLSNDQQAMSLSNDQQAIVDIMEGREMENRHNKQIIAIKKVLTHVLKIVVELEKPQHSALPHSALPHSALQQIKQILVIDRTIVPRGDLDELFENLGTQEALRRLYNGLEDFSKFKKHERKKEYIWSSTTQTGHKPRTLVHNIIDIIVRMTGVKKLVLLQELTKGKALLNCYALDTHTQNKCRQLGLRHNANAATDRDRGSNPAEGFTINETPNRAKNLMRI
jgi:hypothetical protein